MPAITEPPSTASAGQALEQLREELLAMNPRDLVPINVDVAAAALVVIGAASEIRTHRPALVALCGEEMTACVDRLELVARAALQAQAVHRSVETGADVQMLSVELVKLREVLLAEVRALITREVLPRGAIRELQGVNGFKNQCVDVLQLVSILQDQWDIVGPRTGLSLEDIRRAEGAANALATAVGIRNQASRSPAADLRQRAYSLMASTYDQARRMIWFLRWNHGDADRIAPSLFRGRSNGRRRKETSGSDVVQEPALEPTPVDAVGEPTPEPRPVVVSPDMPGAPPFLSS